MICKLMKHSGFLVRKCFTNHLANCGEPLSEPFRDYCFKKVSRIVASVSQTFLCNIPYTLRCLSLISYKNLSQQFLFSGKTTANCYSHNNGNKIDLCLNMTVIPAK